jgi:hypothetical protein
MKEGFGVCNYRLISSHRAPNILLVSSILSLGQLERQILWGERR